MSNPYENCTHVSETCPAESTPTGAVLSFGGAVFFLGAFGLCLLLQLYYGIRGRAWSFMVWMGIGTSFEFFGHLSRMNLAKRPWSESPFLIQYMTLLLAPTFLAAAISVTLKHLVLWYGPHWSLLRPSLYPWVFVGTEFLTIVVQFAGVFTLALSMTENGDPSLGKLGNGMVVGGVIFQIFNMIVCMALMLVYYQRRRASERLGIHMIGSGNSTRSVNFPPAASASEIEAKRTRMFAYAVSVAYPAIAIRCFYRVMEHIPSLADSVRKNEPLFLVFDASTVLISVVLMTIFHPYLYFPFSRPNAREKPSTDGRTYQMNPMS